MLSLQSVLQQRIKIREIAAAHGANSIRIFGSCVRGDAVAESDLDFLVIMDPSRSLLDRIALMHELEDLFGCKVDVVNERALHSSVRNEILAECVAV